MRWMTIALSLAALAAAAACATPGGAPAAAPLENTYWRLVELGGTAAVPAEGAREAHLRFDGDSARVAGSTGCNRLFGRYTRDGDGLRFGDAGTTRMACVDPRLAQQEQRLLAALSATTSHAVAGDTLTLVGAAGPLARLVAATAP